MVGRVGPRETVPVTIRATWTETVSAISIAGEPIYCRHLKDLVKCPVYSGTPLLWKPWGPGEVSCIERCPHFRNTSIVDNLGTW